MADLDLTGNVTTTTALDGTTAAVSISGLVTPGTTTTGQLSTSGAAIFGNVSTSGASVAGQISAGAPGRDGGGAGDMIKSTYDPNNKNSDTFNVDNHVSGTTNKVYTATEKTKLAGIASSATQNSNDATLLNRANHTGTQTASTISNFSSSVSSNADVTANTLARHTHANKTTLDNITAAYTTTEATKLAGIADLATANPNALDGPATSTDNALVRFDGTTGKLAQDSSAQLDDDGNFSVAGVLESNTVAGAPIGVFDEIQEYYTDNGVLIDSVLIRDGQVDGRTIAADGIKLDSIETGANVYVDSDADTRIAAASVGDLSDVTITTPTSGQVLKYDGSAWINDTDNTSSGGSGATAWGDITGTLSDQTDLQTALDNKSDTGHTHTASEVTDFDTEVSNNTEVAANTTARHSHSNKTVLDNTTASFTTADETKLDGIESGADVTDTINVAAAGAFMDSEAGNLATKDTISNADWSGTDLAVVNGGTGASDASTARTNLGLNTKTEILGAIYPVGSLYYSTNSSLPTDISALGTWVAFGPGRMPVFYDSSDTDFNTAEATGGEKTHTLTEAEMPSHTHTTGTGVAFKEGTGAAKGLVQTSGATGTTGATGGDAAHNNMPPYIVIYAWKRTA